MNRCFAPMCKAIICIVFALIALSGTFAIAQPPINPRPGMAQDTPPAPKGVTKERTPLLPLQNRKDIASKLEQVRKEIEANEDEMFGLTRKHKNSLVASRDRWHAELDRVQSEIRLATKDLEEAKTKEEQMSNRIAELRQQSQQQYDDDDSLKTLRDKLANLDAKKEWVRTDTTVVKDKSRRDKSDSVMGEIFDTKIEIAQREEALRISYKGGQAEQLEKQLKELRMDVKVKESAKSTLVTRFDELQGLSADITTYARAERKVDELQILHRKLAELNAQQAVEFLKSIDPKKEDVKPAVVPAK